jgi:hypothetical protein
MESEGCLASAQVQRLAAALAEERLKEPRRTLEIVLDDELKKREVSNGWEKKTYRHWNG